MCGKISSLKEHRAFPDDKSALSRVNLPTQGSPRGEKKNHIYVNKSREGVEKGEEGSEKKGEQIHEQKRSVPLVDFTYGRVFNFLLCREFSRDNDKITSHSAYDVKFHSPKVVGMDKQMCKQDTRLLGNVSGVYSRVVFFECLL